MRKFIFLIMLLCILLLACITNKIGTPDGDCTDFVIKCSGDTVFQSSVSTYSWNGITNNLSYTPCGGDSPKTLSWDIAASCILYKD